MPIEAAMIWNEPNNKSHWDPNLDPDWSIFARTVTLAGQAIGGGSDSQRFCCTSFFLQFTYF